MIVPSLRLILAAGITLPLAGVLSGLSGGILPCLLVVLCVGGAGLDLLLSRQCLAHVAVDLSSRITLARGRKGEIPLSVATKKSGPCSLRLALELPAGLVSSWSEHALQLGVQEAGTKVSWPVTADSRGHFHIHVCRVRAMSRLGFWELQRALPCATEVLVYPDVREGRRQLAALFLNRGHSGLHVHRQVGKGREFEKLRDYIQGDSPEDIHWKASAKRGELVTKEYTIERSQQIYVAVDTSRLSGRRGEKTSSDGNEPFLERMITAALILGQAAAMQGDRFGVIAFSDRVERFIRAGSGRHHFDACRDALYDVHCSSVSPDFDEVAGFIGSRVRHRALLLFLTCLDEPVLAEEFVDALELLARKHVVQVVMPQPVQAEPLFNGEEARDADDVYHRLAGHLTWVDLRRLSQQLGRHNLGMHLVASEGLSSSLVSRYLQVKRRQLL